MKKHSAIVNFILFSPLIIAGVTCFSCKNKMQQKTFVGRMRIYHLSPYTTIDSGRKPMVVLKFLIVEGNIKDMVKTKDTVLAYINKHKEELIYKNDTLTMFNIYESDAKFDPTYKQSHAYPIGKYDRNRILSIVYKQDSLYILDYILHTDSKFFTLSKTPPPNRE